MNIILSILLFLSAVGLLIYLYKYKELFNATILFSLYFFLYTIFPYLWAKHDKLLQKNLYYFPQLFDSQLYQEILISSYSAFVSFIAGYFIFSVFLKILKNKQLLNPVKTRYDLLKNPNSGNLDLVNSGIMIGVCVAGLLSIFLLVGKSGYAYSGIDGLINGSNLLTALKVFCEYLFVFLTMRILLHSKFKFKVFILLSILFGVIILGSNILSGIRKPFYFYLLFFLYVFYSNYKDRIKLKSIITSLILLLFAYSAMVGIYLFRENIDMNFENYQYNFLIPLQAETIFSYLIIPTSINLDKIYLLDIDSLNFYLNPFIQVIPRIIFPSKDNFIYNINYDIAPVGGGNLIAESYLNGGIPTIIITFFILGVLGVLLNKLSQKIISFKFIEIYLYSMLFTTGYNYTIKNVMLYSLILYVFYIMSKSNKKIIIK